MTVQALPPEVIEKILRYLDGVSLARSRQVSSTWKDIIRGLEERHEVWRKCCVREISEDALTEMIGDEICPTNLMGQDGTRWLRLYQQWHRMKRIGKWGCSKITFNVSEESPVTCIKITGSFVVSGHRNGDLHLWDRGDGRHIVRLGHHKLMVLDIALMDLQYEGPYYMTDHHELDRQLVISGGKDHVIQVNPIVADSDWLDEWKPFPMPVMLRHHSDSIMCIKTFGSVVIASCADNSISVWKFQISPEVSWWPQIQLTSLIVGPSSFLQWVGFWKSTVSCLCHDARLWNYSLEGNDGHWVSSTLELMSTKELDNDKVQLVITNCFIFREKILVFLTVDRHFCISIDGCKFRAIPTLMALRSYVVSVNIVGNLLVIGTETGRVYVYYFSTNTDLLNVDLSHPTWWSMASEASIIDIDVNNSSDGPVMAVTSTHALTVVEWTTKETKDDQLCVQLENLGRRSSVD